VQLPPDAGASGGSAMLRAMRSDAESVVIVFWVVLALGLVVGALYDAINGDLLIHLVVLVAAELVLAGLALLAIRVVRRSRAR
jgi:hypothetical protein